MSVMVKEVQDYKILNVDYTVKRNENLCKSQKIKFDSTFSTESLDSFYNIALHLSQREMNKLILVGATLVKKPVFFLFELMTKLN